MIIGFSISTLISMFLPLGINITIMKKSTNNLDQRYNTYSSEKLLDIVIENRASYTAEAIETAEKVLASRGIDWQSLVASSPETSIDETMQPRQLELPNQNVLFFNDTENNDSNLTDSIDDLVEEVEKSDQDITDNFITTYEDLYDEDLIEAYQKVVSEITDRGNFGSVNEQSSIDNYEILVDEILGRELTIKDSNLSKKAKTVNQKHYTQRSKEIKWKIVLSYIFAPLLILFGLFLLVYAFAMHGLPSIKGILVAIAGGRLLAYAFKLKKELKDYRQSV